MEFPNRRVYFDSHQRRRKQNLSSVWVGLSRIVDEKSESMFVIEELKQTNWETVCVQRMMPYPANSGLDAVSKEFILQSDFLGSRTPLVEQIEDVLVRKGWYYMPIRWERCSEQHRKSWEQFESFHEDVLRMVAEFKHTQGSEIWNQGFWSPILNDVWKHIMGRCNPQNT